MENLFDKAFFAVMDGAKFSVDFKTRTLKVGGEVLVENGKTDIPIGGVVDTPGEFLYNVEDNYRLYKHSVPSERSESKRKRYFIALPEHELSDEDMLYGMPRDVAQAQLELYILCQLLLGMQWQEGWGKWFWQSPNDKDLVLLREWF